MRIALQLWFLVAYFVFGWKFGPYLEHVRLHKCNHCRRLTRRNLSSIYYDGESNQGVTCILSIGPIAVCKRHRDKEAAAQKAFMEAAFKEATGAVIVFTRDKSQAETMSMRQSKATMN